MKELCYNIPEEKTTLESMYKNCKKSSSVCHDILHHLMLSYSARNNDLNLGSKADL